MLKSFFEELQKISEEYRTGSSRYTVKIKTSPKKKKKHRDSEDILNKSGYIRDIIR